MEVWFRNPGAYIHECVEEHATRTIWDGAYCVKRKIEPKRYVELFYPTNVDYRLMVVTREHTTEIDRAHDFDNPVAVHPTWTYGQDLNDLEAYAAEGVERIIVQSLPPASQLLARKFLGILSEIQEDYPATMIHVHGLYSYKGIFGYGFAAGDIDGRTDAAQKKIQLTSGKVVHLENIHDHIGAVNLLNMSVSELDDPKKRCRFNIRSALHAAEHWAADLPLASRDAGPVDSESPDYERPTARVARKPRNAKVGDYFYCDTCTIQSTCKVFRTGEVCAIPGSEPVQLAKMFGTRDVDKILDGLGVLIQVNANRLDRALVRETERIEDDPEASLDPEVTKLVTSMFESGQKLAKLLRPSLAGGPKLVQNFATLTNGAPVSTPNMLIAAVTAELESKGIPRADITPELVQATIQGFTGDEPMEAEVVDSD